MNINKYSSKTSNFLKHRRPHGALACVSYPAATRTPICLCCLLKLSLAGIVWTDVWAGIPQFSKKVGENKF